MLVKDVDGEMSSAIMLKDSAFYIEIAKFVQAYTAVIQNPNLFLKEIGENQIDEKTDRVTWQQFSKIMQTCDLGFEGGLTNEELIVYYNYAVEIGSLDRIEKRLASVDEVANAQKHFYNFIDETKDRAEEEYLKQHQITENREREVSYVDNQLSKFKAANIVSAIFMCVFAGLSAFAVFSFFYDNAFADAIGFLLKGAGKQYLGASVLLIVSLVLFVVFDKLYIWSNHKYIKLKNASDVIFTKQDEAYDIESELKHKLNDVNRDFKNVQEELSDKEQKYDVTHNINLLKKSNKYYKELYAEENAMSDTQALETSNTDKQMGDEEDELSPVNLTKEQEENMRSVSKGAISLVGQFDEKAYNDRFEKSRKKDEAEEKSEETEKQEKDEIKVKKVEEKKAKQKQQETKNAVDLEKNAKAEEQKNL